MRNTGAGMSRSEFRNMARCEFSLIYCGMWFGKGPRPDWADGDHPRLKPYQKSEGDNVYDLGLKFDDYMAMRMEGYQGA